LVKSAHELGIHVILDIILNHSGDVFAYKGGTKQWTGQKYEVEGFRDASGRPCIPFRPLVPGKSALQHVEGCAIWPWELQNPECFTREGAISDWGHDPEYLRGDFFSLKHIEMGTGTPDTFVASMALYVVFLSFYKTPGRY
jgi:hypothetical protein